MSTREKIIVQTLNQEAFSNWPDDSKKDLRELLGQMYDKHGAFGMIHHQDELLKGIKNIMAKHDMKEG